MKYGFALLLASFFYCNAHAAEAERPKYVQVGIGSYALSIVYDNSFYGDDNLSGSTLALRGIFSDNFALQGNFYSTEHEDTSLLDNNGTDILVYFGSGLQSTGLKLYAGGGLFRETWDMLGYKVDFNGFQFSGGIGYNWDIFAIDFILSLRDSSDYENFVSSSGSVTAAAASGSLQFSARF